MGLTGEPGIPSECTSPCGKTFQPIQPPMVNIKKKNKALFPKLSTLANWIFFLQISFQNPPPLCSQPPCSPPKTNTFYPYPCKNQHDCPSLYPFQNSYVLRPSYAPSWPSYPSYDPLNRYNLLQQSTITTPAPLKGSPEIAEVDEWFNRKCLNDSFSLMQSS